jgi:hypothetical protein
MRRIALPGALSMVSQRSCLRASAGGPQQPIICHNVDYRLNLRFVASAEFNGVIDPLTL